MKRWVYIAVLALIAAGGIFWSCQKDEISDTEEALNLKKAKVSASSVESIVTWANQSDPVCLGSEVEFTLEGWIGVKNIGVQIYDESQGEWISIQGLPNGQVSSPQTFKMTFTQEKTDSLRFTVSGNQNDGGTNGPQKFYVKVINCNTCDDANFSYDSSNNQDIVFSYNHDEEAEVTIEFTFPQVQNKELNADGKYVAPDGKIYSVNNPKNQTNFTWTGVVSCKADEPTTFAFSFAADCGPDTAKDGKANIWTDAKIIAVNGEAIITVPDDPLTEENEEVIGYSIKGSLDNIVYSGCPIK